VRGTLPSSFKYFFSESASKKCAWFRILIIRRAIADKTSMVQLPGYKRFQNFVKEFKSDFDCLQPQTRRPQFSITFDSDALNQLEGSSTNVKSSLTTTSISNPINSPQPMSELLSLPSYCVLDGSMNMDDII
jgi:hypothetical protein